MSIQRPDWTTGTSYAQQEAMVAFLAERLDANIAYLSSEEKRNGGSTGCVAVITIDGIEHRFDNHGAEHGR